jgi:hypothetical protein
LLPMMLFLWSVRRGELIALGAPGPASLSGLV